jgi:hypothetical protein
VGNGYEVDTKSLHDHIQQVKLIAERIDTAASAAKTVDLGGVSTYGPFFFLVSRGILKLAHGNSVELVSALADMADSYAEALSTEKQNYEELEAENNKMFRETGTDTE